MGLVQRVDRREKRRREWKVMLRLRNLSLPPDKDDRRSLLRVCSRELSVPESRIQALHIRRRSIDARKQHRIIATSQVFMLQNQRLCQGKTIRYDVIFVDGEGEITHIKDAFGDY